jgi:hypothetical protein
MNRTIEPKKPLPLSVTAMVPPNLRMHTLQAGFEPGDYFRLDPHHEDMVAEYGKQAPEQTCEELGSAALRAED